MVGVGAAVSETEESVVALKERLCDAGGSAGVAVQFIDAAKDGTGTAGGRMENQAAACHHLVREGAEMPGDLLWLPQSVRV